MFIRDIKDLLVEKQNGILEISGARMVLLDIEAGFWGIRRQMESLIGDHLSNMVLQQAGANGGASFAKSFIDQTGLEKPDAFAACVEAYQVAGFGKFEIISMEWPVGRIQIRATDAFEAWMFKTKKEKTDRPICAYSAGVFTGFVNIIGERQDVVCIEHTCQANGDKKCLFELIPASEAKDHPVVTYLPDPGLGRRLNLLEMLFERTPMGIAVLDHEYRIQRYNPTWEEFAERYAPPSSTPLAPGVSYFDHLPGTETTVTPLFERVLAGEIIRQNDLRLESQGIVTYWDVVLAPLDEEGETVGILNMAVDTTELVEARQSLEKRVQERTSELASLLQVSREVNSTLELQPLMDLILDQLKTVVDFTGASILTLMENELVVQAYRGPIDWQDARRLRFPLEGALINRKVIQQGEPIVIPDVLSDTPQARMFQRSAGSELESTFGHIRSWLGVPLTVKGEMLGMLTLDHQQPGYFNDRHADLVLAFANLVAVAIENARLYAQAEESATAAERNRLARDLHDAVTQTLFSSSLIAEVLPRLWERDPEEGQRRLQELRELTRGALAEMRTLLLELRPATLAEARLSDLLRQLADSITGRARVQVTLEVEGDCDPEVDVKVALYRIAQEALNNVSKHAEATRVIVTLRRLLPHEEAEGTGAGIMLSIHDDGVGFDPNRITPNSLGLDIMSERAKAIGAIVTIESQPGAGTKIEVLWRINNS